MKKAEWWWRIHFRFGFCRFPLDKGFSLTFRAFIVGISFGWREPSVCAFDELETHLSLWYIPWMPKPGSTVPGWRKVFRKEVSPLAI